MQVESKLTKSQKQRHKTEWREDGKTYRMKTTVRYDDQCGNNHNSFSITCNITENSRDYMGGCCHDIIVKRQPELAHLIKWHLVSSDGPMHYIANTAYHVENNNFDFARSTAIWPDVTDEKLRKLSPEGLKAELKHRLPVLMAEFRKVIESIPFTF